MILHSSVTRQGTGRTENRDVTGSADNSGIYLYVIADGTSRPGSEKLATALTGGLLKSFSNARPASISCLDTALELTLSSLSAIRSTFCPDYPFASASYLALLVLGDTALSIHAGDCCLGLLDKEKNLKWLTAPHCGPNWKGNLSHTAIANNPARKTLLNCMSHRRPHEPQVQSLDVVPDTRWILATDGFWAELSIEDQFKAIEESSLEGCPGEDDCTFMLLMP
ncbi:MULTISPECIES: protein phosphatase 2C domain-containing protein [Pseudomonas]|uniref:Protein phosphatase 2C family protein n=1 Tax=Pseudomonas gessardii TaxID=78544 RepID=A0A7Y1MQM0_9PSED|nr:MULTISPECIES: protein phosphatase 2C domain-containing protein [Pseudomonas]MBH3424661.1 protein phosphatase 2C domain-containing protein [Pseudomonas gessardii]MRU50151.1 protein phosphatase 2C family protein [Pseudomonas gessardii]NNA92619.1 protein phosphatase 2C family protein [Pseudomonas gessardii]NNA96504.1 protein phosphatase 2C family protein [Pseudomonas gessardii]ONH46058.1 serine/threonine protein phosphatase [Pseudomonas gessardii]